MANLDENQISYIEQIFGYFEENRNFDQVVVN